MFLAQHLLIHHRVASRLQSSSFMVIHLLAVIGICTNIMREDPPYEKSPLKGLAYIVISYQGYDKSYQTYFD